MSSWKMEIDDELRDLVASSGGVLTVAVLFEMRG